MRDKNACFNAMNKSTSPPSESRRRYRSLVFSYTSPFRIFVASFFIVVFTLALSLPLARGNVHHIVKASNRLTLHQKLLARSSAVGYGAGRTRLPPVVIVPGTGGNHLEAKLTSDYEAARPWCTNFKDDYFRLWLDVKTLLPPFISCFVDQLSLDYNVETDAYSNIKGVETRVPHFGSTLSMEYLDPSLKFLTAYMIHLVNALKSQGYKVGKSLFGAPYDFRYAPGPQASDVALKYMKDLKKLIEKAHDANDNERVVLFAHSMGGLWSLYFLNQQTVEWRDRYISHFVSVATPWGGAVEQMMTFASGNPEGVPFVNSLVVREEQRRSESNLWLLPVSRVFGLRPLVTSLSRNYTAADMKEFFEDIGFSEGVAPYSSRIPHLTEILQPPKVPVTLIHGYGVPTIDSLSYGIQGFDSDPVITEGDGDGTVNLCSLTAVVKEWQGVQDQDLEVIGLPQKGHMKILHDREALQIMVNVILNSRPQEQLMYY